MKRPVKVKRNKKSAGKNGDSEDYKDESYQAASRRKNNPDDVLEIENKHNKIITRNPKSKVIKKIKHS